MCKIGKPREIPPSSQTARVQLAGETAGCHGMHRKYSVMPSRGSGSAPLPLRFRRATIPRCGFLHAEKRLAPQHFHYCKVGLQRVCRAWDRYLYRATLPSDPQPLRPFISHPLPSPTAYPNSYPSTFVIGSSLTSKPSQFPRLRPKRPQHSCRCFPAEVGLLPPQFPLLSTPSPLPRERGREKLCTMADDLADTKRKDVLAEDAESGRHVQAEEDYPVERVEKVYRKLDLRIIPGT